MADVCRADERAVEVYALYLTIGSQYFEGIPLGLYDRRIVSDADDNAWRSRRNPGANPFDECQLADLGDDHFA
jgi:hypothetical protein